MRNMSALFPQYLYKAGQDQFKDFNKALKEKALSQNDVATMERLKQAPDPVRFDDAVGIAQLKKSMKERDIFAKGLIRKYIEAQEAGAMSKAGVTASLGYNFYDLRAPVLFLYPVNTPFRNSITRKGRVNDGFGTAAHWKATRNPGVPYGMVPEGGRAPQSTPDENDYLSIYKQIGDERAVTFEAEAGGEGYTSNLADEHMRGLHSLFLKEEAQILLGNSGDTSNGLGFQLGTAPTPTIGLTAGGALADAVHISVAVVALTAMGNPNNAQYGYGAMPTVAGGLVPSYTYSAPGTGATVTVNGGTSAISLMSAVVTTGSGSNQATATVAPVVGAFGYAWYVNTTDASAPSLANAHLAAITQFPSFVINALAVSGHQAGNATGLNADHSYNTTDFSGLLTLTGVTAGAVWTDMHGASLTSQNNGRVTEIEAILENLFINFQAGTSTIWGSVDAVLNLDAAIRYNGTQSSAYTVFLQRDAQNNILGGFVCSGYMSRYAVNSPQGAGVIPIKVHPMIPPGTLFFDIEENPYQQSRISQTRELLVQRDYYSIDWPLVSRQYTMGTYAHEVLAHYTPWIQAVLTGIGPFVGS